MRIQLFWQLSAVHKSARKGSVSSSAHTKLPVVISTAVFHQVTGYVISNLALFIAFVFHDFVLLLLICLLVDTLITLTLIMMLKKRKLWVSIVLLVRKFIVYVGVIIKWSWELISFFILVVVVNKAMVMSLLIILLILRIVEIINLMLTAGDIPLPIRILMMTVI